MTGLARQESTDHEASPVEDSPKRTPLPKLQLFLIMLVQLAEPISSTVIYPFVNQSIRETGITRGDERKTGYYAGVIESIFFVTEGLTVLHWTRASDRIGRKPVLLIGLLGLTFSIIAFGLSKTFLAMVVSRCAEGAFNGNIGVTKSVMAEITDASNIAEAFGFIPLIWAVGSTFGPIIGGILSSPATRWPDTLGKLKFLHTYPYFLPCAFAGFVCTICFVLCFVGLKETLPSILERQHRKESKSASDDPISSSMTSLIDHSDDANYGTGAMVQPLGESTRLLPSMDGELGPQTTPKQADPADHKPPPIHTLFIRPVLIPLMNHAFLSFTEQSYQVLLPLMYSTSIPLGGLGFSPYTIGTTMGTWGVINGIFQALAFGKMVRKLGPRKTYIISYSSLMVCIGAYPLMSFLAKRAGRVDAKVWAVLVVQLSFNSLVFMAYGCSSIFIINAAPSRTALATTTGLGQVVGSTMRSLAPSIASSLFSVSLERHLAGGNMVYWILWAITIAGINASFRLPK